MDNIRVSVAMATYNGEKYIEEQLRSILANLNDRDEVIVSDDGSKDKTIRVISAIGDSRVRVVKGPGLGIKKNFENAIRECSGKYIFLSDQDDIWEKGKVDCVLDVFEKTGCPVAVHDCRVIDEKGNTIYKSLFGLKKSGPGVFKNIVRNTYIGCCMAFDREKLSKIILPIPNNIVMHDQWIGIWGDHLGGSAFVPDQLIKYRRHGENSSEIDKHFGLATMLKNRVTFIKELSKRKKELKKSEYLV